MAATTRNSGLIADPLFVGATRPSMRWGVTYSALLFNMVFTMEVFLLTKNLLTGLLCLPIHGVCMLLCARDERPARQERPRRDREERKPRTDKRAAEPSRGRQSDRQRAPEPEPDSEGWNGPIPGFLNVSAL